MNQRPFVWIRIGIAVVTTTMVASCGTGAPRVRGEALLKQTSTAIANARAFSFSTDVPLAIGDLITSDPEKSYLSSQTTGGGWQGEESIDGTNYARLEHHPNVDWTIWIPASGQPLPKQLWGNYKARNRTTTVLFTDWNLNPAVNDALFESHSLTITRALR